MSYQSTRIRSWLREPLLHFLLIGAGLFLLFRLVAGDGGPPKEIVISAPRIEALTRDFARTWMRPPSARELSGLVDDYVKEEIFYREAVTMGLDRDDVVIRRRLRQKLEFASQDTMTALEPTEEQLQDYLEHNTGKFVESTRLSFNQALFSADRRGDTARRDAELALERLVAGRHPPDWTAIGDATLLPAGLEDALPQEISGVFGEDFALQIDQAPVDQWFGPLRSSFGWHVVRVTQRTPEVTPTLEQIRPIVVNQWQIDQGDKVSGEFYQALRSQYAVRIEGELGELLERYKAAGGETGR